MSEIITVGLDLAKNVFQAHGADVLGRAVLRKKLRRDQVLAFFSQLRPCVVAMEACGGAHFWGREIGKLGHEVRLIPPADVKPFVNFCFRTLVTNQTGITPYKLRTAPNYHAAFGCLCSCRGQTNLPQPRRRLISAKH